MQSQCRDILISSKQKFGRTYLGKKTLLIILVLLFLSITITRAARKNTFTTLCLGNPLSQSYIIDI